MKAMLVYSGFITRVIVEDDATHDQIVAAAKQKHIENIATDTEFDQAVEDVFDDKEVPYDPNELHLNQEHLNEILQEQFETVTYKGNKFPIRELSIMIDNERRDVTIATTNLSNAFGSKPELWDEEAAAIDSTLYYYVTPEQIHLPDAELAKCLDEEFELAPEED